MSINRQNAISLYKNSYKIAAIHSKHTALSINMKKHFHQNFRTLAAICLSLFISVASAQAPEKISYQAVVRNSNNSIVSNQAVGIRVSILQGNPNGNAVFVEAHVAATDANGLVSIEIGGGNPVSWSIANINWDNGPFFIKTETDPNGGDNYTIVSTQKLLSVPYALHAKNISTMISTSGDTLFIGNQHMIIPGISAANNNLGVHSCGADSIHNPTLTYGSLTDQDGNIYKTIVIGTQEWMAENLKVAYYRNGDPIPEVTDNVQWEINYSGAYCFMNNDSASSECPYGRLYNWYAAADPRGICPTGWHVPNDAEWTLLENYLGGSAYAGGKLKSTDHQYWAVPNFADNSTGFSAVPSSRRSDAQGFFYPFGGEAYFWTSTETSLYFALNRALSFSQVLVYRFNYSKTNGHSIRCLRD